MKKFFKKYFGKNFLQTLLMKMLEKENKINIVQIGANDGKINDPIYEIVIKNRHKTKILLIEPQTNIIPFLEENYATHPMHFIANKAVGPNKNLYFYRLRPEYYNIFETQRMKNAPNYRVPSGFASFEKSHVYSRVSGHLPANIKIEDAIEEVFVHCSDLKNIIEDFDGFGGVVDFIQIDAEGMDDMVIYSCNIDFFKPKLINFEHKHLKNEAKQKLFDYLDSKGYTIRKVGKSDAVATLNEFFN